MNSPVASPDTVADPSAGGQVLPVVGIFAEITAGLATGNDLETLLVRFLAPLLRLSGAHAGAVRTLTEDGERMQLVGELGLPADVLAAERLVDRHCGACGAAADTDTLTWGIDLRPCAKRGAASRPAAAAGASSCRPASARPRRAPRRRSGAARSAP